MDFKMFTEMLSIPVIEVLIYYHNYWQQQRKKLEDFVLKIILPTN